MKKRIMIASLTSFLILTVYVFNKSFINLNVKKDIQWDVYLDNLKESIVNGEAYVPDNPEIESTNIKAYDVLISKPGDYATWTVDIVNASNVDAKLVSLVQLNPICTSLEIPGNKDDEELVCDNLDYAITHTKTGKNLKISDVIKANKKENVTIKIGYHGEKSPNGEVQITLFDTKFEFAK